MKRLFPAYVGIGAGSVLFCCLIVFSACRTISTQADVPSSGPVDGLLFYYLPIGKITIRGSAPIVPSDDTTKSKRSKQQNASEKEPDETASLASDDSRKPAADDGGSASSSFSGGDVTLNLTAEIEADEGAGAYYVKPRSNYMYEDEVHISVKKHLLSTGNVTTEDKTADIVGAIASTAKTALMMSQGTQPAQPPSFTFSFYPHDEDDVRSVTRELKRRGIVLSVSANGKDVGSGNATVHVPSKKEMKDLKDKAQLFTKDGSPGLLFRPAASYKVLLTSTYKKSLGPAIKVTQQFILPDPTRLYVMKYERLAFVKKVREIGFTDGMLTEFHEKVPSPILGFLGIPKAILQAIVPIPGAAAGGGSGSTSGTSVPKS